MKTNVFQRSPQPVTHEGGRAVRLTPAQELRRVAATAMLGEDTFYESGVSIKQRIVDLVPQVSAIEVSSIAIWAREECNIRHAPLFMVREMARLESHRPFVRETLARVIKRADEIGEFMAMYWSEGKTPIANSVKQGLADAFLKFDAYQLAKYDRDAPVRLRDVMFMVHPKPATVSSGVQSAPINRDNYKRGPVMRHADGQAKDWSDLIAGGLETPDTWEVELSANDGVSKKVKWERLLTENRLGCMALLRNLRNITKEDIPVQLLNDALANTNTARVLPFRFVAASQFCSPEVHRELFAAMLRAVKGMSLPGRTAVVVDVSGSMEQPVSANSDMSFMIAAAGLALIVKAIGEQVDTYSFSENLVAVPVQEGFAMIRAITRSQANGGTYLADALAALWRTEIQYDRVIVVTDEQAHDHVSGKIPLGTRGYVINVAPYERSVVRGDWVGINGFSEAVIRFIIEDEHISYG